MNERQAILKALDMADFSPERAAVLLGCSYRTVIRRMHEYSIPVRKQGSRRLVLKLRDPAEVAQDVAAQPKPQPVVEGMAPRRPGPKSRALDVAITYRPADAFSELFAGGRRAPDSVSAIFRVPVAVCRQMLLPEDDNGNYVVTDEFRKHLSAIAERISKPMPEGYPVELTFNTRLNPQTVCWLDYAGNKHHVGA